MSRLVCELLGIWLSLRHWNPTTALGWLPIGGHAYVGDCRVGAVVCERCGRVEP